MIQNEIFIPNLSPSELIQSKDRVSRLHHFVRWLHMNGYLWLNPDLGAYMTYLHELGTLQPSTIKARIAAVRSRYREILQDSGLLQELQRSLQGTFYDFNECIQQMKIAADPRNTTFVYQAAPRLYANLSAAQVSDLLSRPHIQTLNGMRDVTLFLLMLFTGLRETEISRLMVDHIIINGREGEEGIRVRKGPAITERFVPFIKEFPLQQVLQGWLSHADIESGPVFRGFYRGGKRMRETNLTFQAIDDIFRQYPIKNGEYDLLVKPVDLRIYYAQMLNALDYSLGTISENLGVRLETAANYIGTPLKQDEVIPAIDPRKWEILTKGAI